MEKHYVHPTGFAAAITAGIVYILCAVFVAMSPERALRFFNGWFHGIDLTPLAKTVEITFIGAVLGLIQVMIFVYIIGALFAWIYNHCVEHCQEKGWI